MPLSPNRVQTARTPLNGSRLRTQYEFTSTGAHLSSGGATWSLSKPTCPAEPRGSKPTTNIIHAAMTRQRRDLSLLDPPPRAFFSEMAIGSPIQNLALICLLSAVKSGSWQTRLIPEWTEKGHQDVEGEKRGTWDNSVSGYYDNRGDNFDRSSCPFTRRTCRRPGL